MTTTTAPAPAAPAPSTRRTTRALWAAGALGGLGQSLAGTAAALLAHQISGTERMAGVPQTCVVAGAAVSAVVIGRLSTRHGRVAALALAGTTATAGAVLMTLAAWWMSLPLLLIGALLTGAGNAAVMLGRYAAADLGPTTDRARAMGLVMAVTTVGSLAGPNLLGPTSGLASAVGLPELFGPMALTVGAFVLGAVALVRAPRVPSAPSPEPVGRIPLTATGFAGIAVLSVVNLVMVAVMAVSPVHLHAHGAGLTVVGVVVSLHIAGMFGPSPVTGRLTDRFGPAPMVVAGSAVLVSAGLLAAAAQGSTGVLTVALLLLGVGWNIGLVAGSVLVTRGVPVAQRPRAEGRGDLAMGVAAVIGSTGAGFVSAAGGYAALGVAGAACAALLLPTAWLAARS